MFITLLAVVVVLVLGHTIPAQLTSLRQFHWYQEWLKQLNHWKLAHNSYSVILAVLPPVLLVLIVQLVLQGSWWVNILGLLFAIVMLLWAWGPADLSADVEAIIDSPDSSSRESAISRLGQRGVSPAPDSTSLVEAVINNALWRWFGPLFWFVILGPFGAVLYRLIVVTNQIEEGSLSDGMRKASQLIRAVMEWPIAQLITFSLALISNFDTVLSAWRNARGNTWSLDTKFLGAVANASVNKELQEEVQDYVDEGVIPLLSELPEVRDAMNQTWRIMLLWLVVIALLVIAGWIS